MWEKCKILEHHANVAQLRGLRARAITDQCAVNQHLAAILPLNPCHNAQRGRFPASRGAQQARHLPRFKPQADIIHRELTGKAARQVSDFKSRIRQQKRLTDKNTQAYVCGMR